MVDVFTLLTTLGNASLNLPVALAAFAVGYFSYICIRRRQRFHTDQAFGAQHGCLRVESVLPYEWPLGLDLLKRQYDALPSQRLLAFQSPYIEKYGPTMKVELFGGEGYLTTDPKNIEAILSTHFEDWGLGSRSGGLYPLLGQGIFTQDGRPWKHSREILRKQFIRTQYQNLEAFDQHIDHLINGLSSAADGVVDIQPYFFRYTLSTTTAMLFGEPVGTLGNDVQESFGTNFDYASWVSAIRIRLANFHWLYNPKKFKDACGVVHRYADHFVSQALKSVKQQGKESASSLYPFILDLYTDLNDPRLVRDQLMHVLIAGRDTTACLMSWTFFLLVRHPAVLERLRKEIAAVLPNYDARLTRALLAKMPYLRCVLNETLRLYPQLPFNVREAVRTTILPAGGGPSGTAPVLIQQGTGVVFSVYHMHRRTSLYGPNALDFHPERWENNDLEKRIGWGFMPFHGGPRLCLGKDFALMEASYGIVKIIQTFPNLRLPPEIKKEATGQERQNLTLVVSSADGCKVLLR